MSENVHVSQSSPAHIPLKVATETKSESNSSPRKLNQASPTATFGCHQCPKSFNRRENLSRHLKTHDVPRTHICHICEKTFTRSDLLKRHEAGHERWDKQGPKNEGRRGSAKRRKISTESFTSQDSYQHYNCRPSSQSDLTVLSPLPSGSVRGVESYHASLLENVDKVDKPRLNNFQRSSYIETRPQNGSKRSESAPAFGYSQSQPRINLYPQQYLQSFQEEPLQISDVYQSSLGQSSVPHYGFGSYLQPENGHLPNEWFSHDFYSAMRETGNEWESSFGDQLTANLIAGQQQVKEELDKNSSSGTVVDGLNAAEQPSRLEPIEKLTPTSNVARIPSPPNLPTEDDWPFLWNPSLQPANMLQAGPITIPIEHPLIRDHDPRYDISESTFCKVRAFLVSPVDQVHDRRPLFVLPSLQIVNIFIGLYFENFSHQAPVLHHPTVDTNELPPPLLSAMMIIGASYSGLRNARRFTIVLIDIIGWHLLIAVNLDVSLALDPMMIFTQALLIHVGLWCGNKKAFSVAESFRGQFVTHMRRLSALEKWKPSGKHPLIDDSHDSLHAQWIRWKDEETFRRLHWVVYSIDRQFPALWNLPSSIAIGELVDLGCPCDEVFWIASSARQWKNILGPASVPPSPSFSAAVGPFLLPASLLPSANRFTDRDERRHRSQHLPILDLNPYTKFLVLLALQDKIFNFSQESIVASSFLEDEGLAPIYEDSPCDQYSTPGSRVERPHAHESPFQGLRTRLIRRRQDLASSLTLFSQTYLSQPPMVRHSSSQLFHTISIVQHHLSALLLHISPTDILNSIGKAGQAGIKPAMERLTQWAREDPELAVDVAVKAAEAVVEVNKGVEESTDEEDDGKGVMVDTAAYGAMLLMMGYVILWVFAQVADLDQRKKLMERLERVEGVRESAFWATLESEILGNESGKDDDNTNGTDKERIGPPRALFRNAAEMLMRFGTWGVALDMAMLLHQRAEGIYDLS